MTDAGIDGKLYPFTYWLSEEDDRRLMRIMEVTGVTDESKIVAAGIRSIEEEFDRYGFIAQLEGYEELVKIEDEENFTMMLKSLGLDRIRIIRSAVTAFTILYNELLKEDPENAWIRFRAIILQEEDNNDN